MNLNATILGRHRVCPVRSVLHEVRMAAINGSHRKRQKKLLTALLPQNEHIRTLTLQRPARPTS